MYSWSLSFEGLYRVIHKPRIWVISSPLPLRGYFFKIRRPPQRRRRVTKEPSGVESQDADGESDVDECQARITKLFIKRQNFISNDNCQEGPSTSKFQKWDDTEDKPDDSNQAMDIA